MTATRTRRTTRKAVDTDIVPEDLNLDDTPVIVAPEPAPNRKYMSHANCTHARKGEAGKLARAACRKAIRSYLAAEQEFLSGQSPAADAVAV